MRMMFPSLSPRTYHPSNAAFPGPTKRNSKLCHAYMQLGARGVSVLFASGDGGVSGTQSRDCTKFVPTFPSSCPYVTSVGATVGLAPETAAPFSTGGFSNIFAMPEYQSTAVSGYLSKIGRTNYGLFNSVCLLMFASRTP